MYRVVLVKVLHPTPLVLEQIEKQTADTAPITIYGEKLYLKIQDYATSGSLSAYSVYARAVQDGVEIPLWCVVESTTPLTRSDIAKIVLSVAKPNMVTTALLIDNVGIYLKQYLKQGDEAKHIYDRIEKVVLEVKWPGGSVELDPVLLLALAKAGVGSACVKTVGELLSFLLDSGTINYIKRRLSTLQIDSSKLHELEQKLREVPTHVFAKLLRGAREITEKITEREEQRLAIPA